MTRKTTQPIHPWRICPPGQHYRSATTVSPYVKDDGTQVSGHPRADTCANNPTHKDQLYPDEMREMAKKHFEPFKAKPLGTLKIFKEKGNTYDHLIQGWCKYWNEVLGLKEPLDPDVIKALIATESGFNPNAWNKKNGPERARGLMQVLDKTLPYLTEKHKELSDHFVNLTEDDMLDPNLAICAGIRWLIRKKELAEAKQGKAISWRDAIAKYKGVSTGHDFVKRYDRFFNELKGRK
jgi:hypothetical protein